MPAVTTRRLCPLDIVRPALHLQEELLVVSLARNGALDAPCLHDAVARAQDVHVVLAVGAKPYTKVPVDLHLHLMGPVSRKITVSPKGTTWLGYSLSMCLAKAERPSCRLRRNLS